MYNLKTIVNKLKLLKADSSLIHRLRVTELKNTLQKKNTSEDNSYHHALDRKKMKLKIIIFGDVFF